jgi:uncharacterized protein (DUF433 family)
MSTSPTQQQSWIAKTPGVVGGDACIRATRHSVAGLVQWRRLGLSDREIIRRHPDLSPADLAAAWEYYRSNAAEIDRAIEEEEDA